MKEGRKSKKVRRKAEEKETTIQIKIEIRRESNIGEYRGKETQNLSRNKRGR
jgi:hypothetical protein